MKIRWRYNHYIYMITGILVGFDLIHRSKINYGIYNIFLGLYIIMIINEALRISSFYKTMNQYFLSILASIIISGILSYNIGGYVDIFKYSILYELIIFTRGKVSNLLIALEIALIFFILLLRHTIIYDLFRGEFWKKGLLNLAILYIGIIFYLLSLFAIRSLRREKRKVDKLNKELALSYDKLKEQSERIEELTISKERNRLAGEIHDNLGHSLVALNMNLDVAEKIINKDWERARELIVKSQDLTKESMENLRKAVYALKAKKTSTLKNSIGEIIANIESTGIVKVKLNMDQRAEDLVPEYKEIIYSFIKEALTNSIKHGKAKAIDIKISLDKDKVRVKVVDNGLGCNKLIKGNGLLGIEARISEYSASVKYGNNGNHGFSIEIILDK